MIWNKVVLGLGRSLGSWAQGSAHPTDLNP